MHLLRELLLELHYLICLLLDDLLLLLILRVVNKVAPRALVLLVHYIRLLHAQIELLGFQRDWRLILASLLRGGLVCHRHLILNIEDLVGLLERNSVNDLGTRPSGKGRSVN